MEGTRKEDRHRVHVKELKNRQKHNAPSETKRPEVLPQQPFPDDELPTSHRIEEDVGLDFRDLISKNTTGGRSFVFKTEKDWDKDVRLASNFEHLFELDVQRLARGIATIPFHQRFNLEDIDLSQDLVEKFELEAVERRKEFAKEINLVRKPKSVPSASSSSPLARNQEAPVLPRMRAQPFKPATTVDNPVTTKEDIQNWLDDVLDI